MAYRYALDCGVAEAILTLSARQRQEFIQIFRDLAEHPFQSGEESFRDSQQREIQKKAFGRWIVSYWADHAVSEVRIVGVQKRKA